MYPITEVSIFSHICMLPAAAFPLFLRKNRVERRTETRVKGH
ncbi:MAG: hypothetical protein N3F63_05990 [Thermoplasmata archaeon]|nr:hypothetical protein [Thermoplasmata archaeon]